MPKKQHTEEQIISALKQYEGGEKTGDICRKLGCRPQKSDPCLCGGSFEKIFMVNSSQDGR
jgi:hypothetical protein